MCTFHGRALLVARSIYAARAAMAGRPAVWPPPGEGPDPFCPEVRRFFAEGGPPPEARPRGIGFSRRCEAVDPDEATAAPVGSVPRPDA